MTGDSERRLTFTKGELTIYMSTYNKKILGTLVDGKNKGVLKSNYSIECQDSFMMKLVVMKCLSSKLTKQLYML